MITSRLMLTLALVLALGCASGFVSKEITPFDFSSTPKELVLLSGSAYDPEIRMALASQGFKVKKLSSVHEIEEEARSGEKRSYSKAEARIGMTIYLGGILDVCIGNASIVKFSKVTWELSDLETNQVLLYLSNGGWTSQCGIHRNTLWEPLAEALAAKWQ